MRQSLHPEKRPVRSTDLRRISTIKAALGSDTDAADKAATKAVLGLPDDSSSSVSSIPRSTGDASKKHTDDISDDVDEGPSERRGWASWFSFGSMHKSADACPFKIFLVFSRGVHQCHLRHLMRGQVPLY